MSSSWKNLVLFTALTCGIPACGGGSDFRPVEPKDPGGRTADGGSSTSDRRDPDAGTRTTEVPAEDAGSRRTDTPSGDAGRNTDTARGDGGSARTDSPADGGGRSQPTQEDVTPGTATLKIVNANPNFTGVGLFVGYADDTEWSDNLLGNQTIDPGDTITLKEVPCEERLKLALVSDRDTKIQEDDFTLDCDVVTTMRIAP